MLLVCLTLLPSCDVIGRADCSAWRPILTGEGDTLTRETAAAILAHNRLGRRICGW